MICCYKTIFYITNFRLKTTYSGMTCQLGKKKLCAQLGEKLFVGQLLRLETGQGSG